MPEDRSAPLARIEAIKLLKPEPGDLIHVKVGMTAEELGDGVAWIPGPEELAMTREEYMRILPEGVGLIVTHQGIETAALVKEPNDDQANQ